MNCDEFAKLRAALVDDELSGRDLEEVRLHLAACPSCRLLAEREREYLEGLRKALKPAPAPAGVRGRALALVKAAPAPARRRWLGGPWVWAPAASALLACLVLAFTPLGRSYPGQPCRCGACQQFVDDHTGLALKDASPFLATDDPEQLSSWFRDAQPGAAAIPSVSGSRLLGGRWCVLNGCRFEMATYRTGDSQVSLFRQPPPLACQRGWDFCGDKHYLAAVRGYTLLAFQGREGVSVLVSDLPARRLEEFSRQAHLGGSTGEL